jgi:hypothetical protein
MIATPHVSIPSSDQGIRAMIDDVDDHLPAIDFRSISQSGAVEMVPGTRDEVLFHRLPLAESEDPAARVEVSRCYSRDASAHNLDCC